MCNLYAMMKSRAEAAALARAFDQNNNQPPLAGIYPDTEAPVVIVGEDGHLQMRNMRWGMPSSKQALFKAATQRADKLRAKGTEFDFAELLKMEPDRGTTNVRNTTSTTTGKTNAHWAPWLGSANRCLVPFTSFAEPDQDGEGTRQNIWFAFGEERPLRFFAGVWTPHACVRMISKGWEEVEAYGFLTTDAAEPVKTYHRKAMPVILTTEADCDLWLSGAPWDDVKHLQRPLPDGTLKIVARGVRKDEAVPA
jgi:putative SOS response-associated peptidase YedK